MKTVGCRALDASQLVALIDEARAWLPDGVLIESARLIVDDLELDLLRVSDTIDPRQEAEDATYPHVEKLRAALGGWVRS